MDAFPVNVSDLLTVGGLATFVGVVVQIIKRKLPDWRWTTELAIGLAIVVAIGATLIARGLDWNTAVEAVLLGLLAGCLASGGYEAILNALAKVGKGSRTNEALAAQADATLTKALEGK